jgi:L-alanine-DL-glutamate epimerase-like enolase superfamily enzyme
MMNRRDFAASFAAMAGLSGAAGNPRIRRIRFAPIEGRFHKFVAMNAYDRAPKGHTYTGTLTIFETDAGVEGIGTTGYRRPDQVMLADAARLIGADPLALYTEENGCLAAPVTQFADVLTRQRHFDGPLFDLIGKLRRKPVWRLIGESARDRVEAYDGTLYFSDVWFRDRGVRAVVEEAEEALSKGYRGLKLKLGRGSKWMDADEGLRRDVEVVKAVRAAAGRGVRLMGDPNDGYRNDFERAWRLMQETADANLFWMEEIFPENIEHYTALRERMLEAGMKTLIADGENFREARQFEPYLKPRRLMDVLQLDIRQGGFLDCREMARMGEAAGAVSVPHNWGSQIGGLMGLQISKALQSVIAAEDDRSTCDVIQAEGYSFSNGYYTLPDEPGMGIRVDAKVYREKCLSNETVVS